MLFDEVEKAHSDVLNVLLQIMEDGILTDGKGRTINFKNTILVMTSNVGSKRIVEIARGQVASRNDERGNEQAMPSSSTSPISPEDALKKLQSNPKATPLLIKAATDPEIMGAIRTAMNGSPADLLELGRDNKNVASFLRDLYAIMDEKTEEPSTVSVNGGASSSGLTAIRQSMQESVSQWSAPAKDAFAAGIIQQIDRGMETDADFLYTQMANVVKEELEAAMKPELLNRIDEIVVFSPLSSTNLIDIAKLIVNRILKRVEDMDVQVDQSVLQQIVVEGSAKASQFGARPIRRAAQRYIEDSLSDALIQGFVQPNESVLLKLGAPTATGKQVVTVVRSRDKQSLDVEVEDASGGIDGTIEAKRTVQQQSEYLPSSSRA